MVSCDPFVAADTTAQNGALQSRTFTTEAGATAGVRFARSDARAVAPVVGVICLVAVTVVAGAAVGAVVTISPPDPAPGVAVSVTATADGEVTLVHRGGRQLDVDSIRVELAVDGEPLRHQPPVPFVGATGYRGAPSGAFNAAADGTWEAGERTALRIASTNAPPLEPGAQLTVEIRTADAQTVHAETTVRA